MRDIVFLYCTPGFVINCILLFFSLTLEAYFNRFPKNLALKLFISIFEIYIGSNLAIVFASHNDLQSW